jgi:hypothetical protein
VSARWRDYVNDRLRALEAGEGDYEGLQQPTTATVRRARLFVDAYFDLGTLTPSVVPTAEGEVAFVWHAAGWHLEADVGQATHVFGRRLGRGRPYAFAGPLEAHEQVFLRTLSAISHTLAAHRKANT